MTSIRSRVALVVSALTGVVLMAVPCGRKNSGGGDPPETATIVTAFSPSNLRVDPTITAAEAVTLDLGGIGTFVFVGGQQWLEYSDSTVRFTAELADLADRTRRFQLSMRAGSLRLGRALDAADLDLTLDPAAYAINGGPVDPATWTTYARFHGRLIGQGGLAGNEVTIELEPGRLLQVGEGANNGNVYFGAFAKLLWHRAVGASLPTGGNGTVALTLQADTVLRAEAARSEQPFESSNSRHAILLPGIAENLVFAYGGQFTERPDGTARLTGVAHDEADPARSFYVDVRFGARVRPGDPVYPPSGSPELALNSGSYVSAGGPVDPAIWSYYESVNGSLVGLRDLTGARLEVVRRGPAFQLGVGANGKNARLGGSGWLSTTVVTQPANGPGLGDSTGGDINITLEPTGVGHCAEAAQRDDSVAPYQGGHAFWLPSIGTDFVFQPGAEFTERADGTASLAGVIYSVALPERQFTVQVTLADRVDPGAPGYAPPGSPKLELHASAYRAQGGPIDPAGWHYYGTLVGTLEGLAALRGARLEIERRGPSFQLGLGANGKNQRFGGSGWLDVAVIAQPATGALLPTEPLHGDINIDLNGDCTMCAGGAKRDALVARYEGSHAFYLPGISHDFVFESGARFAEFPDGTATLVGVLTSPSRLGWRLRATVDLAGRLNSGDAGHPPAGSPKKELVAASFVEHGGPIDTRAWRYYTQLTGRLQGLDELAGAILDIDRVGPAPQIGSGASGKNHGLGLASWIAVNLVQQPTTGIGLPGVLENGDINLDLMGACVECVAGAPSDPEVSNIGGHAAFWFQGLGSGSFEFEGPGTFEERGDGTARLAGVLRDVTGGDHRWALDLRFTDRAEPLFGDPLPAGSPKRDLRGDRYSDLGGPIDFMRWRYYRHTEGELVGLGRHAGAVVRLTRMGPSTQLGRGASGRNEGHGASGWLVTEVTAQPTQGTYIAVQSGDFNLDLFGCDVCATPAEQDTQAAATAGGHAFYFPGIGTDFIFEGNAPFVERPDGTARLSGTIFRPGQPNSRFRVEVDFSGRLDPGQPGHAPSGSPKLELFSTWYATSGGPIDPHAWRYYTAFEGRAYGEANFAGGELRFVRFGPAFQIGFGASGKNLLLGAAGWLDVVVVRQPSTGQPLVPMQGEHGDININLGSSCQ